ncbi:hypothetical protein KSF78_0009063 [Schistosoma japonicum]|nr:hypothetical protein KSF78_0009063 [Schistosoma japonicum]
MYIRGSRPLDYVEKNNALIPNFNEKTGDGFLVYQETPNYSELKFKGNTPLLIKSTPYTVYKGSVSLLQSTVGTQVWSYRKQKNFLNSDKDDVHVAFKKIHFLITKTLIKRSPQSGIINELPVTSHELKSSLSNSDELSVKSFNDRAGLNINYSLGSYKKSVGTQFELFKKYHELKDIEVKIIHQDHQSNFQSKKPKHLLGENASIEDDTNQLHLLMKYNYPGKESNKCSSEQQEHLNDQYIVKPLVGNLQLINYPSCHIILTKQGVSVSPMRKTLSNFELDKSKNYKECYHFSKTILFQVKNLSILKLLKDTIDSIEKIDNNDTVFYINKDILPKLDLLCQQSMDFSFSIEKNALSS